MKLNTANQGETCELMLIYSINFLTWPMEFLSKGSFPTTEPYK